MISYKGPHKTTGDRKDRATVNKHNKITFAFGIGYTPYSTIRGFRSITGNTFSSRGQLVVGAY